MGVPMHRSGGGGRVYVGENDTVSYDDDGWVVITRPYPSASAALFMFVLRNEPGAFCALRFPG